MLLHPPYHLGSRIFTQMIDKWYVFSTPSLQVFLWITTNSQELWWDCTYHLILKFPCSVLVLHNYGTSESIILGTFPNCFLTGASWLLLNYYSSHDMNADLPGHLILYEQCCLFFFRIQFKDHLMVSETFFVALMRCTPTLPEVCRCITQSHQTENDILAPSHLSIPSGSLSQWSQFSEVLTIARTRCENPIYALGSFSLQPGTSYMLTTLLGF